MEGERKRRSVDAISTIVKLLDRTAFRKQVIPTFIIRHIKLPIGDPLIYRSYLPIMLQLLTALGV